MLRRIKYVHQVKRKKAKEKEEQKVKKKILAIALACGLIFSLTACGSDSSDDSSSASSSSSSSSSSSASDSSETAESSETEQTVGTVDDVEIATGDYSDISIGVVMKLYDEFQNKVIDGAEAAAAELNASISCVAPDDITDAAQQVQMIENFISQEVDILLVDPNIADSVITILNQAVDEGITVILVDTDSPNFDGKATFVGTVNYDAAYEGATEFASRLPEGANVVIATGQQGDDNHEKRSSAFKAAMEDAGCTVLELQYCDNSADLTASAVEDWIQKYGVDGIDAVMCTDDDASMGAIQAIKSNNATDSIMVCSFNGFQVALQAIAEGTLEMTIGQQPYEMGYTAVMAGIGAMEGAEYPYQIEIGVDIIDSTNYADFLE